MWLLIEWNFLLEVHEHLEEQKAQKRRISRKVTAVRQIMKAANVKARRYIDYEPTDDLASDAVDETPTMYCETIDAAKDLAEATVLSKDANDIVKVARQTHENIERILNGPKINSFENYYISKGESLATGESPAANASTGKEQ